eukprot:4320155-Prymnesium_polylepis.1
MLWRERVISAPRRDRKLCECVSLWRARALGRRSRFMRVVRLAAWGATARERISVPADRPRAASVCEHACGR